ncbi:N-6 DNA methylase [bacterium]|nr:N-6 DNA methylase [bacterium]RQV96302.1 MAG: hypothetical protein EH221_04855 [bacterium]
MNKKKIWQINSQKLAEDIKKIAHKADSEEDLKMGMEPLLQNALKKMGVDVSIVKYEKTHTSFKGRIDAVYGYLTIEYKVPGKLFKKADINSAIKQLQHYLGEQAKYFQKNKEDFLEKAVGVATDGKRILFLRFTKVSTVLQTPIPVESEQAMLFPELEARRGFQILGPYPINKSSISNLLIFFRASARRPLTAEYLAEVFAPSCQIVQQTIAQLYTILVKTQRRQTPSRIKMFFQEWDRIFGVVYGQELEKAEKSAAETAKIYQMSSGIRLKQFLFAIHTFYAFLMKIISVELISLQSGSTVKSFVKGLTGQNDVALKERLNYLESGADFINKGIENFLEADFFSWYLDGWNEHIASAFRNILNALSDFEPATPILEPEWTRDLLQKLYEMLVPKKLRHDLGEYYTPEWLAGYVVDRSGYKGHLNSRFLDPACGSGTFLVHAINRTIRNAKDNPEAISKYIIENIVGFDLNPIAVLSARTNYLIAFSRLLPFIRPISIPVYLCDSVLTPTRYIEEGKLDLENTIVFTTTKGNYTFPVSMKYKSQIDQFTTMMDVALRGKVEPNLFEKNLYKVFSLPEKETSMLAVVYKRIKELDDQGENGIWARYIKNAFAPVYLGKFDYVIGNPPWIRWGYLSDDYRQKTLRLWKKYGLFSLKGYATRLGGGEKDFSMLFTYASADNYLKDNGTLGFLITMEVFKSKGAGEGFRKFELGDTRIPLKALCMEDMVDLKPFQSANKTAILFLKKGEKTTYPVDVIEWKRKSGIGRIQPHWTLDEVKKNSDARKILATPVDPKRLNSSWQTAKQSSLRIYKNVKGKNSYKAHLGARVEPYGIFWLKINEVRPDGILVVENIHDRGKRKIKSTQTSIESKLVYPAVSGGDIVKFGVKNHFYLLISQNPEKRAPYNEDWMIQKAPLTYAYLKQFEDVLLSRGSRIVKELAEKTEFYAMYGIGEYTFSKYRVVWKRMASKMSAVVISSIKTDFGMKIIVPTDTTAFFALNDKDEAHYLCSILNSKIVNDFIKSFSSAGRGFGAPSIMNNLAIPRFDNNNQLHQQLVSLSEKSHNLVKAGKQIDKVENEINGLVRKLWNIR